MQVSEWLIYMSVCVCVWETKDRQSERDGQRERDKKYEQGDSTFGLNIKYTQINLQSESA